MNLLTIDPGSLTGWARFVNARLVESGRMKPAELFFRLQGLCHGVSFALVETPLIYPGGRSPVPDQDILRLGILAGKYLGACQAYGCSIEETTPVGWKGTIPKPKKGEQYIIEERVLEILAPQEVALIRKTKSGKFDHNEIDAIGMGLRRLGRKYRGATK